MLRNLLRSDVGLLSDAGVDGGFGNILRNRWGNTRIKRRRDDVVGVALVVRNQRSDGMRSSDLHLLVDLGGANVQRTAEQAWEGQYVVDLVRVVRTAGADNGSASFFSQSRVDLRGWVSTGKDDWIFGHGLDHILGQDARSGYADKDVCALDDVGQRTGDLLRVRDLRHFSFDRVETVAAFIDGALAVAEDGVRNACGEQQLGDCDGRCASAADNDMNVLDVFADNLQRIDQASQGDDGSAVLVIVEDRDVADFFELLLDVEALWGLDVLEVDAAVLILFMVVFAFLVALK